MHPGELAAAHFVPVIIGHLHLGDSGHLDLGDGDDVVEPGFACGLLREEPQQLLAGGGFGDPREQRVVLAGAGVVKGLEPGDEGIGIGRDARGADGDFAAQFLRKAPSRRRSLASRSIACAQSSVGVAGLRR